MANKPVIGLSGGIGSGKSLVAKMLTSLDCGVIDADKIAHELLSDSEICETIHGWWGDSVVMDGAPHRIWYPNHKGIATIVFADPAEMKKLEDLLFPKIRQRQAVLIAEHDEDESIRAIVLDAPKLYEAGVDSLCDAVIFVKSDRKSQIARIEARGWTEAQLIQREDMQLPLSTKEEKADHVVENNSSMDALRSQVDKVFSFIMSEIGLTKLIPWLDMHQQHSQQREWFQSLVQKSDSSIEMYHRRIVELLKKDFGCSDEMRRFGIELNKQKYVLWYHPVNDGRVELFPLESIE